MDKEAQEKIVRYMVKNHGREWDKEPEVVKLSYKGIASNILDILEELGYRKPSPELREKIAEIVLEYDDKLKSFLAGLNDHPSFTECIDALLALIVPKDKPPLLSDEEILEAHSTVDLDSCRVKHCREDRTFIDSAKVVKLNHQAIAQAQREADIKWYEGD